MFNLLDYIVWVYAQLPDDIDRKCQSYFCMELMCNTNLTTPVDQNILSCSPRLTDPYIIL